MEEKIKENESVETSGETETILSVPPAHKKHSFAGLIREMWPAYLIEIIVIILGISITLGLEEWRDNNREAHLEQIYLRNLHADIEVDIKTLEQALTGTKKLLERGNELLGYVRNPDNKNIQTALVSEDVREILGRPNFISDDASFTDLKSSGNLHLIKDIQLKNLLFAYYRETQHIKEVQDAERQAAIIISGTYFLKRFSLDTGRNLIPISTGELNEILKNVEFGNNVLLRVFNRNELLNIYKNADSLGLQLKNELIKK